MQLTILVNAVDRTAEAEAHLDAIRLRREISGRVSTFECVFQVPVGAWSPIELQEVVAVDEFGAVRFGGYITRISREFVSPELVDISVTCSDYTWHLEQATIPAATFTGQSDRAIIQSLVGTYCPELHAYTADLAVLAAVVPTFEVKDKTLRQALAELCTLTGGEYYVGVDKQIRYFAPAGIIAAPFELTTDPGGEAFRLDGYSTDFSRPINRCTLIGAVLDGGTELRVTYEDPASIAAYGVHAWTIVDRDVTIGAIGALKAQAMVEANAWPQESGRATLWTDGLDVGQTITITHDFYGLVADFLIRALEIVFTESGPEYSIEFGDPAPTTDRLIEALDARSRAATAVPTAVPATGSVTDASIGTGGLSAVSIGSVNAASITGTITSGQIGSVSAAAIVGSINAGQIASITAAQITGTLSSAQIGSINAASITGTLSAGQIGSVNAASITGVIVTAQLADHILDTATKLGSGLFGSGIVIDGSIVRSTNDSSGNLIANGSFESGLADFAVVGDAAVVDSIYAQSGGRFATVSQTGSGGIWYGPVPVAEGDAYIAEGYLASLDGVSTVRPGFGIRFSNNSDTLHNTTGGTSDHFVGPTYSGPGWNKVTTGQVTVPAGYRYMWVLVGWFFGTSGTLAVDGVRLEKVVDASRISTVNATSITGLITAGQVSAVNASSITGTISASQISSITAGQITGMLSASQIASVNASAISGSITAAQISAVSASVISGTISAGQLAGGITASQITSVNVGALTGGQISENLLPNPGFEFALSGWTLSNGAAQPNAWGVVAEPRSGASSLKHSPGGTTGSANFAVAYSGWFDITQGEEYTAECWVYASNVAAATGSTFELAVEAFDATMTTSYGTLCYASTTGAAAWGAGWYKLSGSGTPVTTAAKARVALISRNHTTGSPWYVDDVIFVRKVRGSQIAPLTINASHIAAVNASAISGTITSSQIATVSASQITGTLNASQINSISATQITGSITAGQIASLSVSQLTGSITGSQIGSLTITGGNIADSTITNVKIANISADKITGGTIAATVTLTSPILDINNASLRLQIDPTNYVKIEDKSGSRLASLRGAYCRIESTTNPTLFAQISGGVVTSSDASGNTVQLQSGGVYVNGAQVVKARYGVRPVTNADVIALLVYHGLCA